jgi:type VI secretion system protein VasJ
MSVEEVVAASKARIESLLVPVNGGVGDDVSYDERFEAVKTEIDKLQSLTGEQVNWGNVASLAGELLEAKSKDFRLVCYAAAARLQEASLESVLDAMVLMTEFVQAFWEPCHPPLKRIRARAGILAFMGEQAGKVKDIKLQAKDLDLVQAIDQLSSALDGDLRDKFGEAFPGLGDLREGARYLARSCPKEKPPEPKPEPKPAAAGAADAAGGAAAAPAAAAPVRMVVQATQPVDPSLLTDVGQVEHVVPNAGRLLVKASSLLRAAKPENPLAYRLARLGMWIDLNELPSATDGNTLVPPPPEGLKSRLDSLLAANDLLTLINEAEDAAAEFILWLDPHRYAAAAMDRMGALFLKAKEALVTETAMLLRRLPTLPSLAFSTGEPFADGQTKMWLDGEVAGALGGGGGGASAASEPSVLDEPIKEAKALATQGKLPEAVAGLGKAAASAPTPADRFRGRLALAQLCLQSGQFGVARAQLLGLCTDIDRHELTSWQPGLCAEVYAALFGAYKGANTGPDVPAEQLVAQARAFEQLCRLDPAMALKLGEAK